MDAAESQLTGDVGPSVAGGLVRYRIWPAKRHPFLAAAALVAIVGATVGVWLAFQSIIWTVVVLLGLTGAGAILFFPTLVALDGPTLHLRQLGAPRTWDLRQFKHLEASSELVARVELRTKPSLNAMDSVRNVQVPMPADRETAERVLVHLRRWVGRRPSGMFELDADHAPEDHVDEP